MPHRTRILCAPLLAALAMAACGDDQTSATTAAQLPLSSYVPAFTQMVAGEKADIDRQNAVKLGDPALPAIINHQVKLRMDFDATVQRIAFPDLARNQVHALLDADNALEGTLLALATTTKDPANYQLLSSSSIKARSRFAAADAALRKQAGL